MKSNELLVDAITRIIDRMDAEVVYRGRLSPRQVAEGMNAASRNAVRLLKDAEILFEAKRYPSAAALAALAIEEAGKLPILRALAVAQDGSEVKEGWKQYRSHQTKNVLWLMPLMFSVEYEHCLGSTRCLILRANTGSDWTN